MNNFREHQPQRRPNRPICVNFSSYKDTLQEDFGRRCGYCNNHDKWRIRSFTIDHFLPQNPAGCTHDKLPNDYYNLVYACMHCNLAKSNKWPTNDPTLPHNGLIGFVDPELPAYAGLLERNESGEIIPRNNSPLGAYIIEEIKLWLPIHAKMWRFDQLMDFHHRLDTLPENKKNQIVKDKINELAGAIVGLIRDIFNENN